MARKRFTAEQIIMKLREAEVGLARGKSVRQVCKLIGVPLNPICQEELCNPGRDVSINPNENAILTPQRPVPDVVTCGILIPKDVIWELSCVLHRSLHPQLVGS